MSGAVGNDGGASCEPSDDMATTLSASVELPAPHAPKCACCASLDDALVVIASLQSQLNEAMKADNEREDFEGCLFGCTPDVYAPRCPNHGSTLRLAENPDD